MKITTKNKVPQHLQLSLNLTCTKNLEVNLEFKTFTSKIGRNAFSKTISYWVDYN